MEYRKMEKLGISVSLLGFGCMRFPTQEDGTIDEPLAEKMMDTAFAGGVNYYDTAYVYHDGKSEAFTGRVLNKYDRSSYYLATKLPCWEVQSVADAERLLQEQLDRLDKKHIDFYLLHSLGKDSWKRMVDLGILELCDKWKAEGKIRYFGFSFHDDYPVFEEIITYRQWDFCQIQINYIDTEDQAGMKGYLLAEKLDVPVIVMEPIKGSSLANLPDDILKVFTTLRPDASAASWALRWTGSLQHAKVILSGMSTMDQVIENLKTFTFFKPITKEDSKAIEEVTGSIRALMKNGCTACKYCMPCPFGVDIPGNFHLWNEFGMFKNAGHMRWAWGNMIEDAQKAHNCTECGVCEDACPQRITIRSDLKKVQMELDAL
jgi:predicted aldo/keto reductase-like oxidoreductase